jgi:hypothetical protein
MQGTVEAVLGSDCLDLVRRRKALRQQAGSGIAADQAQREERQADGGKRSEQACADSATGAG